MILIRASKLSRIENAFLKKELEDMSKTVRKTRTVAVSGPEVSELPEGPEATDAESGKSRHLLKRKVLTLVDKYRKHEVDVEDLPAFREEERAAAERKRREAKPAAPARPFGGTGGKRLWSVGLSRPSLWWRFDKGVAKIGRWFYYKMDDISDWPMYAWYILAGLTPLIILISAWVNSGFILVLVLFLIGAALFEFLLGIVVIVGAGIKLLFKLPLLILRLLFYNGLTFILSLAAAGLGILWLTLQ